MGLRLQISGKIWLCLCCAALLGNCAVAEVYQSTHFEIHSDLDPNFVEYLQKNIEAFYSNLTRKYFSGGGKPLEIYYSQTSSDTFRLLGKHGHRERNSELKTKTSYYISSKPAVYTHYRIKEGAKLSIGVLFHEITHHFVRINFQDPPAWFNEGLACFFGNATRIVKGKVILGQPHPRRDAELKKRIEQRILPNIKRLYSMGGRKLYKWPAGYHYSRVLFCWLYENGYLEQYLTKVRMDGYGIEVLEEVVGLSTARINIELLHFMKRECFASGFLYESRHAGDPNEKERLICEALKLKPDYDAAQFALAKCFYRRGDYDGCLEKLAPIFEKPDSQQFRSSSKLAGRSCYKKKEYAKALEYYQKTLEYSDYYHRKYELYYWIACCYHYIGDYSKARVSYKMFLDKKWEPDRWSKRVKYAQKYQNRDIK